VARKARRGDREQGWGGQGRSGGGLVSIEGGMSGARAMRRRGGICDSRKSVEGRVCGDSTSE